MSFGQPARPCGRVREHMGMTDRQFWNISINSRRSYCSCAQESGFRPCPTFSLFHFSTIALNTPRPRSRCSSSARRSWGCPPIPRCAFMHHPGKSFAIWRVLLTFTAISSRQDRYEFVLPCHSYYILYRYGHHEAVSKILFAFSLSSEIAVSSSCN